MVSKKVPKRLLGYCLVHQAGILSRIACRNILQIDLEEVTGQKQDIS